MSELRGRLMEEINTSLDERSDLTPGSEERQRHDQSIVNMVDALNRDLKLDYDDYAEERRLTHDTEVKNAELKQQAEIAAEEQKSSRLKTVVQIGGLVLGGGLALLVRNDEKEGAYTEGAVSDVPKFVKLFSFLSK